MFFFSSKISGGYNNPILYDHGSVNRDIMVDVEASSHQRVSLRGEFAVEVAGISKSYGSGKGKVPVLRGLDLTVHKGAM